MAGADGSLLGADGVPTTTDGEPTSGGSSGASEGDDEGEGSSEGDGRPWKGDDEGGGSSEGDAALVPPRPAGLPASRTSRASLSASPGLPAARRGGVLSDQHAWLDKHEVAEWIQEAHELAEEAAELAKLAAARKVSAVPSISPRGSTPRLVSRPLVLSTRAVPSARR